MIDAEARVGVFLFAPEGAEVPADLRDRLGAAVAEAADEIVWVDESSREVPPETGARLRAQGIRILRTPGPRGYGGARKAAFDYAVERGFETVVALRADGVHPFDRVEPLLARARASPDRVVIASRFAGPMPRDRRGLAFLRRAAHRITNRATNALLRLDLHDHLSGLRVYPGRALASVPFHLDSDDRDFDIELLIQLRALGARFEEVPTGAAWREFPDDRSGLLGILRATRAALGYRLHQLHATRDGRYLIDRGPHYALKVSPLGSHMQIVEAIPPGSRVLDLGCSQGLLARPLAERGVRLVGVDRSPPGDISPYVEAYHQHDLDTPLDDLPLDRSFDRVLISDVIEHLRNRRQLLVGARRTLREGGRLIASTPNVALWFYRLSLLVGRFEYGDRGVLDRTHVHLYTRATFRREIERAGFRIVGERVTALPFEVVFESTGRSEWIRRAERAYHALARLWPEMFAYQFVLEAEITTLDEAPEP